MTKKYEWNCPLCGKYHYGRISYWDTGKCKVCFNEVFVDNDDKVKAIYYRCG